VSPVYRYPTVPEDWKPAFRDYQRLLARQFAVLTAWASIVLIPLFQITDWWIDPATRDLWWQHLAWRSPPVLLAMVVLWLRYYRPDGGWPRGAGLLLGVAVMAMMVGLFAMHHLAGTGVMHLMVHGLIMTTAAVAVVATAGARDLAVIYGPPLLSLMLLVFISNTDFVAAMNLLVHPLLMAVIGCVIAEVLFQSRVRAFNDRQRLHHNAMTDPLTALLNRRAMEGQLQVEHARSTRHDDQYALIMADLDLFKKVNDTYGHDVGDEVLEDLASRMRDSVRMEDAVARWGGEEFLILLRATGREDAVTVAEKIRHKVADRAFVTNAGSLPVTISLGVAVFDGEGDPAEVVKRADQALYAAKHNGRNRVEVA